MRTFYFSTILTVIFAGCYSGTVTYIASGRPGAVVNSIEVNKSKDSTWNQLVAGLSSNFFVINTMDNKSGFINLNYTGDPEKYVDGGAFHYTIDDGHGRVQSYGFPGSRASVVYQAMVNGIHRDVSRQLELKGKMNLLVAELSPTRSRLTVNISYILNLKIASDSVHHETISFSTGQSARSSLDSAEYRSNGKLEQSILEMVR
jgi:hypothetical protein